MKNLIIYVLVSFFLTFLCGLVVIPVLRKIKAGQPILHYVQSHKDKNGTPTMGGLFFIIPSVTAYFIFNGFYNRMATLCVVIGVSFMLVGFLDDYLKIRHKENEGLKAYQKIIFQTFIAVFAGVFCYENGITVFYIPFYKSSVNLGYFTIPLVAFVFIAITNSVNLTDGLDGLVSSVSVPFLLSIVLLIIVEQNQFDYMYLNKEEYQGLISLAICLLGGILAFLIFNTNKASVFMGDTGSLSLGGFLGSISIFSSNSLFIPVLGITFVLSSVTVIIQVLHYKRTKKRVFLMAPIHHHFQMKGKSEPQICYVYSLITCIMGMVSIIFYL